MPDKDVNQAMQDLMLDAMRRSQEAVVDVVRSWRSQSDSSAMSMPGGMPGVPTMPSGVTPEQIDAAFDFAERMLADQRRFTKNLMSLAMPAEAGGSSGPQSASGKGKP